jgi:hypothetical protein
MFELNKLVNVSLAEKLAHLSALASTHNATFPLVQSVCAWTFKQFKNKKPANNNIAV